MHPIIILFLAVLCSKIFPAQDFVSVQIYGQLGNNLFQVATGTALAWNNNAKLYLQEFDSNSPIYKHVFFRFDNSTPTEPIQFQWQEPTYAYKNISYHPNMQIAGYFQSEKYFHHYRDRLLNLLAPHPDDESYIQKKYQWIITHPNTVGIQLRYYKWEFPTEDLYPQYGKDYLETAMSLFPKSSLFVVSSNNLAFARSCIPYWVENIVFIENEPNYIDLYLLSYCKHNIITNSSFGWWGAWLNRNPDKIVIRPHIWIKGLSTQDVCPKEWIVLDAPYE